MLRSTTATPVAQRSRARRLLVVGAVTCVAVLSGCVPDTPSAPPGDTEHSTARNLRVELVTIGVTLSWEAAAQITEFEVAWRRAGSSTWSTELVAGRSTTVGGLTNLARYEYRVRAAPTPSEPDPHWSGTTAETYYQLTLPVVDIDTGGAPIRNKEDYVPGQFAVAPNGSGYGAYSGAVEVRGRGNTTWDLPKKPYRVRLASKAPLMGMPSSRHWVLLANYNDRSQLRTTTGQGLASMTSLEWSPQSRMVELVLNGKYQGVYQLIQHVRVDSDRVDIDELEPTDITEPEVTGGYLLEVDFRIRYGGNPLAIRTKRGAEISLDTPDEPAPEQMAYIRSALQRFEDALYSSQFADPDLGYRAYVDLDSLVDSYLVSEFTMQLDAFYTSTWFYKKRGDDRFRFGPMWDFDVAVAPVNDIITTPWPANMPWVRNPLINFRRGGAGVWLERLFQDPTFVAAIHDRWQELKDPFRSLIEELDEMQAPLLPAIGADSVRWDRGTLGDYHRASAIQSWMRARWAWMNSAM